MNNRIFAAVQERENREEMILYFEENVKWDERKKRLEEALDHYCRWRQTSYCQDKAGRNHFELDFGKHGKPYLQEKAGDGAPICFSISHSGRFWICGIDDSPIGVDIEDRRLRQEDACKLQRIASRFFAPKEVLFANTPEKFYRVWTRKEAYIKYKGTGISEGLDSFSTVDHNNRPVNKIGKAYIYEMDFLKGKVCDCHRVFCACCSLKPPAAEPEYVFSLEELRQR